MQTTFKNKLSYMLKGLIRQDRFIKTHSLFMQKNQLFSKLLQLKQRIRKTIKENKMSQPRNHCPQLLQTVINNKQSIFVLASYLTFEDLHSLHIAVKQNQTVYLSDQIDKLITTMLFTKQYLNRVDRTMAYFIHQNQFVKEVDDFSTLYMTEKTFKEVQSVVESYRELFAGLRKRCKMDEEQVNALERIITEPELPLPSAIRSQVGRFCSSSFQLFLCSKVTKATHFFTPQSQFQQFKTHILDNQDNYLRDILSSIQHHQTNQPFSLYHIIKQLFHNPVTFVEKLSGENMLLNQGNEVFNFFIIIVKLAKNMLTSIKLRLQSVSYDPYVYFTELMLRYSLYKFSMLELQQCFGPIFTSFQSIIRQTLNIGKGRYEISQLSLWKLMMGMFSSQLEQQIRKAIPIYINLMHKVKLMGNNDVYKRLGRIEGQKNIVEGFQQHEGSEVLEYLLMEDNIDTSQVYLSDFVQMLIDLSITQDTVLLCGHSQQFLIGLYQQWQQSILQHELQILNNLLNHNYDQQKTLIQSQIQFVNKKLNLKPRTIRQLLGKINRNSVEMDFSLTDRELLEVNKRYVGELYQMKNSQQSRKSSVTAQQSQNDKEIYQMDLQGLEYFSEIDEEQLVDF